MEICIVGKYPPIEGGVSTNTYWLARGLSERGHNVHVITNADEVEDPYRISLESSDWPQYQPGTKNGPGRVRVYNPARFARRPMAHIPETNPFVSKLASLATDVIRRNRCEVILAYYFEPYVVAAWLASCWTGKPLIAKHAGSDLERLCRVPDLATTYKEILSAVEAVVTQPGLMRRFHGMGVSPSRLEADVPYCVPTDSFSASAKPLEIDSFDLEDGTPRSRAFDSSLPVIGIYGKIGMYKGTFDLVAAIARLRKEGQLINLAAMIGQGQAGVLRRAAREAEVDDCTYLLPLLPNWRVPNFIRACDAVCFLERDFPIPIHGPIVPREVLACGVCLVVSREIASKQRYRELLCHGENVIIVEDPKDHAELAEALRFVAADRLRARKLGERGSLISRTIEDYDGYIRGWETLLQKYASLGVRRGSVADNRMSRLAALELAVPDLFALVRERAADDVDRFLRGPTGTTPDIVIAFCDHMVRVFSSQPATDATWMVDALRYARARIMAMYDRVGESTIGYPVTDRLDGRTVSREAAWNLWPIRSSAARVEAFDWEVSTLFAPAMLFGTRTPEERSLPDVVARPTLVLFSRAANLAACELRIDEPTRALVDACDGSRTTEGVTEELRRRFGITDADRGDELEESVLSALDRLYGAGVIVFGERAHGEGWAGGWRGSVEPSEAGDRA